MVEEKKRKTNFTAILTYSSASRQQTSELSQNHKQNQCNRLKRKREKSRNRERRRRRKRRRQYLNYRKPYNDDCKQIHLANPLDPQHILQFERSLRFHSSPICSAIGSKTDSQICLSFFLFGGSSNSVPTKFGNRDLAVKSQVEIQFWSQVNLHYRKLVGNVRDLRIQSQLAISQVKSLSFKSKKKKKWWRCILAQLLPNALQFSLFVILYLSFSYFSIFYLDLSPQVMSQPWTSTVRIRP